VRPLTSHSTDEVDGIVERLGLQPHPEGGWYAETWRHDPGGGGRGAGTAIYYLLAAGQRSHWHRVDATEVWHFYAGDPLRLHVYDGPGPSEVTGPTRPAPGAGVTEVLLGPDLAAGHVPQGIVPADAWQSAEPVGAWTLVGCTVSPAFEFSTFELAPPTWSPPL
jgi:predicted cupin superfamily sugar epimerase